MQLTKRALVGAVLVIGGLVAGTRAARKRAGQHRPGDQVDTTHIPPLSGEL